MSNDNEEAWIELDEEEQERLEDLFDQIRDRCRLSKILYDEVPDEDGFGPTLMVKIPSGREVREVLINDEEDAKSLLEIPFEKYRFIPGYDAIFAAESGEVEVAVRSLGSSTPFGVTGPDFMRLMGGRTGSSRSRTRSFKLYSPEKDPHETSITVQANGSVLSAFLSRRVPLSLIIRRPGLDTAELAEQALVKLSDALFFQFENLANVALGLARERIAAPLPSVNGTTSLQDNLQYPAMEYDKAPISLYWYGRNAVGMPLLQFLAYYQVLEYYYPIYSKAEATRRLQRALKEPGFRADRDADVSRLLNVIQDARSGGFFDERSQLKATLTECLDAKSLNEYLTATPERRAWFGKKNDALGTRAMPFTDARMDVINEVAERIYQIRCKIVHTKAEGGGGEVELLLPYSKEAAMLSLDIELVRYVSQRVLIAASAPFQLN